MADPAPLDDAAHLGPARQLAGLGLGGEDRHVGSLKRVEDRGGHRDGWARSEVLEHEHLDRCANRSHFVGQACRDRLGVAVGGEGDQFVGLDAEAGPDRVPRSG